MTDFDIIVVYHNERAQQQFEDLNARLEELHPGEFTMHGVSNREDNRGFAKACNIGAREGSAPFIGFLNPDVVVKGPFLHKIRKTFDVKKVVVTGENFGKARFDISYWGCHEWVCGAAFFIRRSTWEQLKGFDEQFVWSHEETDLIRRVQAQELGVVRPIKLAIEHDSPSDDDPSDTEYKQFYFKKGNELFWRKWNGR